MTNVRYELTRDKPGTVTFETPDSTILRATSERRKIDVRVGGLIISGYVRKIHSERMLDNLTIHTVEMEQSEPPKLSNGPSHNNYYVTPKEYLDKGQASNYRIFGPYSVVLPYDQLTTQAEKKMKKFAVGSTQFETLAEAVACAKERVEGNGMATAITKIIRIVRRKPQPVVVEIVK